MRRPSLKLLASICCLLLTVAPRAQPAVPAGFEMLAEEQTNAVDVYYGNQFLVSVLATFTPTGIRFEAPREIIAQIPDLLDSEEVLAALSGELPTHNELLCLRAGQTHCGTLSPDIAEVIFDEARFRADLFINPGFIAVRDLHLDRYLPPSDAGLGLLQTFSTAFTGSEGQPLTYSVNGWTTVSRGESRIGMISNYTDTQGLKVDALAAQRAIRGREWQAGLYRSQSSRLTFLSQADLLGVRVASSLDTLANLDQVEGNELTLFLPARSRVDIYKDDRLYSSRIYELGNQVLDTSQLPGGAYDVRLVIRDNFGQSREETRFYVKSSRLPPRGERLYFLDAGEVRERLADARFPRSTGRHLARGGFSQRLGDHMAMDLGAEVNSGESLFEIGGAYLLRGGELHGNLALSDRGDAAIAINGRGRVAAITFAGSLRRNWVRHAGPTGLIRDSGRQASFNIGGPLAEGRLQFDVNVNDRGDLDDRTYSTTYDFNGWRAGKQQIDFSVQLARNNDNLQFLLNLEWRWQGPDWSAGIRPRFQHTRPDQGGPESSLQTSGIVSWNRLTPGNELRMTGRAVTGHQADSLEYEIDHSSNAGRAQLNLDYADRGSGGALNYGGSFSGSIIADHEGVAFGGRDQSQSAIVVSLDGAGDDGYFEVMINGSTNTIARIGERTIINLRPFQTYEVYLQDRGAAYLQYDDQVRRITLYPGNVITLQWDVREVIVVFGRLLRADGTPVANALLENLPGLATTDDDGFFQAQMPATQKTLQARTRSATCAAPVGAYRMRQKIGLLGTLTCE